MVMADDTLPFGFIAEFGIPWMFCLELVKCNSGVVTENLLLLSLEEFPELHEDASVIACSSKCVTFCS